jgi:hypothetical protein
MIYYANHENMIAKVELSIQPATIETPSRKYTGSKGCDGLNGAMLNGLRREDAPTSR